MWRVFWFARCKFYAHLGSNQPKKWQNRQKMSKNGHFMAIFWPYGLGYGAETQTTVISIGTRDLVRFWALSDAWKYHLLRTSTLVWLGASEAPAPLVCTDLLKQRNQFCLALMIYDPCNGNARELCKKLQKEKQLIQNHNSNSVKSCDIWPLSRSWLQKLPHSSIRPSWVGQ